jgi:hypothetical protein
MGLLRRQDYLQQLFIMGTGGPTLRSGSGTTSGFISRYVLKLNLFRTAVGLDPGPIETSPPLLITG